MDERYLLVMPGARVDPVPTSVEIGEEVTVGIQLDNCGSELPEKVHFEITRNKLDELLTHIKRLSFADWLNTLRIEYAKNLLLTHNKYTIDAISSMSGYSSRSAFYAAFKKVTNITPTEFIRQAKNNSEE